MSKPDDTEKPDDTDDTPAIETAINSTRRSRYKAQKQDDIALTAFLLRQEAALLSIQADRTDQLVLALETPPDATEPT